MKQNAADRTESQSPQDRRSPLKREGLLEAILDSAVLGILTVDQRGVIQSANRYAHALFGFDDETLVGENLESLLPDSISERHAQHRRRFFSGPTPRPMRVGLDLEARRRDGSTFPVEVQLGYLPSQDDPLAIAFVSDVTVRRNLQDQLIQSQRMEAVGQLAGGIAHDFNNLLTVVLGYNSLMLEGLPAGALREAAEEIQKAGDRAGALVQQLFAVSSRRLSNLETVDVNSVVRETYSMLRPVIGEHIELRLALGEDAPSIPADRSQIEQVILNMAVNARDALPNGGRLVIETCEVDVEPQFGPRRPGVPPGRYLQLTISDNGAGMTQETRRRAFDPFYTTKPASKGTGLGLSTVYAIVKRHGGDIWVYSEVGQGATFKIYLPAGDAGERKCSAQEDRAAADSCRGARVLVVEDDAALRGLVARILRDAGHQVYTAGDMETALAVSEGASGDLDLLLSDIVLPNGVGTELAETLLRTHPGTAVLFVSGYAAGVLESLDRLPYEAGFLPKPFGRIQLLNAVGRALAGRAAATA